MLKKFKLLIDLVSYTCAIHLIFNHTYELYMLLSGAEQCISIHAKIFLGLAQGCTTITKPKVASVTLISQNSGPQL